MVRIYENEMMFAEILVNVNDYHCTQYSISFIVHGIKLYKIMMGLPVRAKLQGNTILIVPKIQIIKLWRKVTHTSTQLNHMHVATSTRELKFCQPLCSHKYG